MRLEDHLVAGFGLEPDTEQKVVKISWSGYVGCAFGRVACSVINLSLRALGLADEAEVQVRVDGCTKTEPGQAE